MPQMTDEQARKGVEGLARAQHEQDQRDGKATSYDQARRDAARDGERYQREANERKR